LTVSILTIEERKSIEKEGKSKRKKKRKEVVAVERSQVGGGDGSAYRDGRNH